LNAQKTQVLFLGNSYTAANNLPNTFYQLALSRGDTVYYDSNTPGGQRLMGHAVNSTSLSKIKSQDWDFVVLQAQSQEPSWSPSQVNAEVYPAAIQLNDSIKANNACTETVFFMTWGRKYGDASNCAGWPPVCTYLGMQNRLMVGYLTMAELTNSTVAPCGMAWMNSRNSNPLVELYSTDNSHPIEAGTYLNACVMYATMFQKSSTGATYYGTLSQADAEFLQHIADSTVLSSTYNYYLNDTITSINFNLDWESWFKKGNIVFSDFDYTEAIPGNIDFTDLALNADSYIWDFGDGSSSTDTSPSHVYIGSSNYTVTQHVSNACFSDTASLIISIVLDVEELSNDNGLKIYPNPCKETIQIEILNDFGCDVSIVDVQGQVVYVGNISSNQARLDMSGFSKGVYFIQLETSNGSFNKKIIIE